MLLTHKIMPDPKNKIAVIGAGIAGLTAAYLLSSQHNVTLFEKNKYLGGHTNTIVLKEGPDAGTPIDTGFIVFNDRNYSLFQQLLSRLGIQGQPSDMSFSFSGPNGNPEYSSYFPNGLFAQRKNIASPSFWKMLFEIIRFNQRAIKDLEKGNLANLTLGDYLKRHAFDSGLVQNYLIPMGAAIWSTPPLQMMLFPAETIIRFFFNHGLLVMKGRPNWMTVPRGSHEYVKKIRQTISGLVNTECGKIRVKRLKDSVQLAWHGDTYSFDYVVLAAHANESLALLEDPDENEKKWLGSWKYTENHTVLHTDVAAMPKNRRAWASWNYIKESDSASEPVSLTYHMNRLQRLSVSQDYFVTLNRTKPYPKNSIIEEFCYTHPQFDFDSIRSQEYLPKLNGVRRTFFCGSYFGYGFHEDAVRSSLNVAKHFGISL